MLRFVALKIFTLASLLPALSFAKPTLEDGSIEPEIVVTGARSQSEYNADLSNTAGFSAIKITEIPQSLQVITRDLLLDQGALSLAEVLANNAGATGAAARSVPFSTAFAQLRGQDVQLFRDGLRDVDFSDVDSSALTNIARIDILKGPGGLVFGTGGPGGIINIITKKPEQKRRLEFSSTFGSQGTFILAADISLPLGGSFGIRATGELERSDNFIDFSEIERDNGSLVLGFDNGGALRARVQLERHSNRDDQANSFVGLPPVGTIVARDQIALSRSLYLGEPAFDFLKLNGTIAAAFVEYDFTDAITAEIAARYTQVKFERSDIGSLGTLNITTSLLPRARFRQENLESNQFNTRALLESDS